jgi:hypothetical protein
MERSIVRVVHCSTAEEFFESISPRGPYFISESPQRTWVYRGHSNDQLYRLVPSAFRKKALVRITPFNCISNRSQMKAEAQIIRKFFWIADKGGLQLPEDSQELREEVDSLHSKLKSAPEWEGLWPPKRLLSLVGLMQHYGLPTRLLDWSGNYLIAAYFAAVEAAANITKNESKTLSVWAYCLHAHALDKILLKYCGKNLDVVVVTSPSASNSNLRAQQGLFTLCYPNLIKLDEPVDRRSLDEVLQSNKSGLNDDKVEETPVSAMLYRFTLPAMESRVLLWLLAKEGVTGSAAYPGYDGVAQALKEQALWELPWSAESE